MEIQGKINSAICCANVIEDEAVLQIRRICDYPFSDDSKIRIMPNVHYNIIAKKGDKNHVRSNSRRYSRKSF